MKGLRVLFAIALVAAIIVGVIYWLRHRPQQIPTPFVTQGRLQIYALDVGQGDSFLIITPEGKSVLIDAGLPQAGDEVVAALRKRNIQSLDLAVATHPHADHIGGMRLVIENFGVKNFLDSGQIYASKEYERMLRAIKEKGIKFIEAKKGMKFDLDSGVEFEVLNPEGNGQWITKVRRGGSVENANSVVLRLTYGNFSMLFTGDAETETEDLMMKSGVPLRAQVLKVGHHGSRYATSAKFLEAVAPEAAVISVGAGNRYGHPAPQTLDRLQEAGVKIYRTDLNGEIAIVTDGNKFEIHTAKQTIQVALLSGSRFQVSGRNLRNRSFTDT
ncbi:MAG TPA: ComEC/Rec2 family competence protein [Blastocatellia bacterium]|nr:ComEC/Rec2 family competence protein [Blastocatellia bacterium]